MFDRQKMDFKFCSNAYNILAYLFILNFSIKVYQILVLSSTKAVLSYLIEQPWFNSCCFYVKVYIWVKIFSNQSSYHSYLNFPYSCSHNFSNAPQCKRNIHLINHCETSNEIWELEKYNLFGGSNLLGNF